MVSMREAEKNIHIMGGIHPYYRIHALMEPLKTTLHYILVNWGRNYNYVTFDQKNYKMVSRWFL